MAHRFTRQELYDLVWSEPIKTFAGKYRISDVGLAKACRRADIPLPPRGYWAKAQAGKKTIQVPLPARGLGMADSVSFGGNRYWSGYLDSKEIMTMEIPPAPECPETAEQLTDRVQKLVGTVVVPSTFAKAHRFIVRLLADDDTRRAKQSAVTYVSIWDAPYFESPFERRRLKLINAIFVATERAGMRPWMRGKYAREFGVYVGDQDVTILLEHAGDKREFYGPPSEKNRPAFEKLKLEISGWRKPEGTPTLWEDQPNEPLESKIKGIVVGIIVAGEMQHRLGRIQHREWLIERKAELIEEERKRQEEAARKERERRIKEEKARVDRLLGEAAALRQATDIRTYVESVRQLNCTFPEPVPQQEFDRWATWALE